MLPEDKLGPNENQSPRHKNHPSDSGNPKLTAEEIEYNLIGGNKHSATGGGTDEDYGSNECIKTARKNQGIDNCEDYNSDNFNEESD